MKITHSNTNLSVIHVEVQLKCKFRSSPSEQSKLKETIQEWLLADSETFQSYVLLALYTNGNAFVDVEMDANLKSIVNGISISIDSLESFEFGLTHETPFTGKDFQFEFYFYRLFDETMENGCDENLPSTFHTILPSASLDRLWESLIFDSNISQKLLNYVQTSLIFGKRRVNPAIVAWNKVILLHGPPGTGKTSLCKALCQKVAIRLQNTYENYQLIEINAHSLFSKWFSESGKLVMKLFEEIREFAESESNMLFVLIDEVESLAYDRQRTNSADPSDAIRVVNALLTQLDSIKRYHNVIILANSNVTDAMDTAFVDRADIKQYVGYPSCAAIYAIYYSCIRELIHCKMIDDQDSLVPRYHPGIQSSLTSEHLMQIAQRSQGLSGRTLRKLPFLAFALSTSNHKLDSIPLSDFMNLLDKIVIKQIEDNQHFNNK